MKARKPKNNTRKKPDVFTFFFSNPERKPKSENNRAYNPKGPIVKKSMSKPVKNP